MLFTPKEEVKKKRGFLVKMNQKDEKLKKRLINYALFTYGSIHSLSYARTKSCGW